MTGCYFNSGAQREVVAAQAAINNQDFLSAKSKLENVLRFEISNELRIKVLHQIGILKAFHLNDLLGALDAFKKVLAFSRTADEKKRSQVFLADLYYSKIRNFKESEGLYLKLFREEDARDLKSEYFKRYQKSLFENGKCKTVVKNNNIFQHWALNYEMKLIEGLCYYFQNNNISALKLLNEIETKLSIDEYQKIEMEFYRALIFEETENLKEAYSKYVELMIVFPYPEIIKYRIERILHRKKSIKR